MKNEINYGLMISFIIFFTVIMLPYLAAYIYIFEALFSNTLLFYLVIFVIGILITIFIGLLLNILSKRTEKAAAITFLIHLIFDGVIVYLSDMGKIALIGSLILSIIFLIPLTKGVEDEDIIRY